MIKELTYKMIKILSENGKFFLDRKKEKKIEFMKNKSKYIFFLLIYN
jgi:hypothetical protein